MLRMTVEGVGFDPNGQTVVVLKDASGKRLLPVWIGPVEARAIQLELEGQQPPRPLSHDLMLGLVSQLGATVERIVINDLIEAVFYATIDLKTPRGMRHVDARPSDAIALAVRARCPIYVDGPILDALLDAEDVRPVAPPEERLETNGNGDEEEIERFRRLLED